MWFTSWGPLRHCYGNGCLPPYNELVAMPIELTTLSSGATELGLKGEREGVEGGAEQCSFFFSYSSQKCNNNTDVCDSFRDAPFCCWKSCFLSNLSSSFRFWSEQEELWGRRRNMRKWAKTELGKSQPEYIQGGFFIRGPRMCSAKTRNERRFSLQRGLFFLL